MPWPLLVYLVQIEMTRRWLDWSIFDFASMPAESLKEKVPSSMHTALDHSETVGSRRRIPYCREKVREGGAERVGVKRLV